MTFLWGAATSSHQIEGGNTNNDWWQWELQGRIDGKVTSGRATDHWNRSREDMKLAKELGLNTYRFSVEWSRCEPKPGEWDYAAIEWYQALLDQCENNGLLPMLTLHHFTLPLWLAEKGGLTHPETPERFARFVRLIVSKLGSRIPLWCTINEPMALVVGAYLGSFMPPSVRDPFRASQALRNLFDAHVRAYDIIHQEMPERTGPWRHYPLMVGFAHNMIDFRPLRQWHPMEWITKRVFCHFYNRSWPDAVTGRRQHFGLPGVIPYAPEVAAGRGRKTVDFLGINYYMKLYVTMPPHFEAPSPAFGKSDPERGNSSLPVQVVFSKKGDVTSDLGWAIHPLGLTRMIRLMGKYGLPLFITENGIADKADTSRPQYLHAHLSEIAGAMAKGADIRGYYHWSLLDNFEWIKGFAPRFGLYEVDYDTFERKPRPSARLYAKIISLHSQSQANPSERLIDQAYRQF